MSTTRVLRHDLTVVRRTVVGKLLLALSLTATLGSVLAGHALSNGPLTGDFLSLSLWLVAGTALPFGVLATAAVTIAADRESGRLRLLFGTPITKTDVFAGTLLSRLLVMCGAIVTGFALTGLVALVLPTDTDSLVKFTLYTLLLCAAYTSVGVTVSAVSSTRLRAVGAAIAFYVWSALWPHIVSTVSGTGNRIGEPTTAETVPHFVGTLSPFGAYSQIVTPPRAIYAESVTGSLLTTPTMTVVLVGWLVVPIPVGYWWFSRIDL